MEGGESPAKRARGERGGKNRPSKQRWAQNQALKLGVVVPCKFPSSASSSDKVVGETAGAGTPSTAAIASETAQGPDLAGEAASKKAQCLDPAGGAASKTAQGPDPAGEATVQGPDPAGEVANVGAGSDGPLPGPGAVASASTTASAARCTDRRSAL